MGREEGPEKELDCSSWLRIPLLLFFSLGESKAEADTDADAATAAAAARVFRLGFVLFPSRLVLLLPFVLLGPSSTSSSLLARTSGTLFPASS